MKKTRKLCFGDCETNPFEQGVTVYKPLIFGVAVYSSDYQFEQYLSFTSMKKFVKYITSFDNYCYFHNGGKFDFLFFREYFEEGDILYINGRIAKFSLGLCEFRDSFLFLPIALGEYKKDKFDYSKLKHFKKYRSEIEEYLKDDCVYLSEIMIHFFKSFGEELTIASAALKYFSKLDKIKKGEYKTKSDIYDSSFRKFYFGGRVEVFRSGFSENVSCYDINSAYPYAMLKNHPWGFKFFRANNLRDVKPHSFLRVFGVAHGCFPYRIKTGVSFPRDEKEREYYVTGWEYLIAQKLGAFRGKILDCFTHVKTRNFENYIKHFYELKKKSSKKSADYVLAKFGLNSLYGKFGQNPRTFKDTKIYHFDTLEESYVIDGKRWNLVNIIDGNKKMALVETQSECNTFLNVAISASITGCQRAYLFESLWKSENVCYCDTDSIICTKLGTDKIDSHKLGYWDKEGSFSKIWIGGKKLYCAFANGEIVKWASKGARLDAPKFEELIENDEVIWENDKPTFHARGKKETEFLRRLIRKNSDVWIDKLSY